VIIVGFTTALYALGEWLTGLGSNLPTGWVGYAPIGDQFSTVGLHPWVRLVIWIVLVAVWVFASVKLLGTKFPDRNDGD
jgi:hypothetical protein